MNVKLRWGFKKEAAELAAEARAEIGLGPFDRLDPRLLVQHLDIPIVLLSDLAPTCRGALYFLDEERETFSALTVFEGHRRVIIHNDAHSPARQHSNLAHELAHGLLLHEPQPALDAKTGCRLCNATNEYEADWLASELLVTREMALAVARGRFTRQAAMERLGVSAPMLTWRLNMTGAVKRARSERAKRGAS